MIEQQKRKGPELPLVPVKRQRHELMLGAAGSGPGAGQQQAAPGALLQAVSVREQEAFGPQLIFLLRELHRGSPVGPSAYCGAARNLYLELRQKNTVKAADALRIPHTFPCLTAVFSISISL